ncbi:hypothetical protein PW52_05740 [Tamlana sedimentorum]|uniref:PNPLA domain-containing protein n=1 Tax=Neotamlana sedimentorum TaxID=1435349 RepID=A0A0D7WBQ3_9FLAO|nr:hypothetical protein [Tamlana sedimentorum]KJD36113.1 hypothetical protein PW52_05740 [Tamlana sedimentorum]
MKLSHWLKQLLSVVLKNFIALLFVIVVYIVFRVDHLKDLVVVIIQHKYHVFIMIAFYASILVLAFLISYGNLIEVEKLKELRIKNIYRKEFGFWKNISNIIQHLNIKDSKEKELVNSKTKVANLENIEETPKAYINRVYPKMLATYMILGITFSVNSTYYDIFQTHIAFKGLFWLLTLFLLFLTNPNFSNFLKTKLKWNSKNGTFPLITVLVLFLVIIFLGINSKHGTQSDIRNLFLSLFCLTCIFFFLSITYNKKLLSFKAKVIMPIGYILTLGSFVTYFVMFIGPALNKLKIFTPIVIILICLIGLYIIFMSLYYLGRYKQWPVLTVTFFTAILLTILVARSKSFKHYEVVTVDANKDLHPDNRLSLNEYIKQFIAERKNAILNLKKGKQFPIILVSAEGGGSRAGLWSLLVHSYLYEKNKDYFKKHLFSITGASGGSVGNNIFYAVASENETNNGSISFKNESNKKSFIYKGSDFFKEDYISSSIAGLLGRDLLASIFHLNCYQDRGEITQVEWEQQFDSVFNAKGLLQKPYLDVMPKKGAKFTPPILVTTTTQVQKGRLYVISPVKFDKPHGFYDLLEEYAYNITDKQAIKRSTAMLLTARFPYISPNARISGIGQFGDGGYYDNIGGTVTKYLEEALIKALQSDTLLTNKWKIKHLVIYNNTKETNDKCTCSKQKNNDSINYYSQLFTPAKMVLSSVFAHADEFIKASANDVLIESKRTLIPIDLYEQRTTDELPCDSLFRPLIPLSRYLSNDAVKSLENRLENKIEVANRLDKLLEYK